MWLQGCGSSGRASLKRRGEAQTRQECQPQPPAEEVVPTRLCEAVSNNGIMAVSARKTKTVVSPTPGQSSSFTVCLLAHLPLRRERNGRRGERENRDREKRESERREREKRESERRESERNSGPEICLSDVQVLSRPLCICV